MSEEKSLRISQVNWNNLSPFGKSRRSRGCWNVWEPSSGIGVSQNQEQTSDSHRKIVYFRASTIAWASVFPQKLCIQSPDQQSQCKKGGLWGVTRSWAQGPLNRITAVTEEVRRNQPLAASAFEGTGRTFLGRLREPVRALPSPWFCHDLHHRLFILAWTD